MRKSVVALPVIVLALAMSTMLALAAQPTLYSAGDTTVGIFANDVNQSITGLHIEFDSEVTITNKIEIGGLLPSTSELTGTVFDFVGGSLVSEGVVELDWQPADARPVLTQWLSEASSIGTPYFATLEALGSLLAQGIVQVREANPEVLALAMQQLFADNEEYFASVSESLGMPLEDSLMPVIMTAPAEGIANFFNTLVGMLGVETVDQFINGAVDMSALLSLLGL